MTWRTCLTLVAIVVAASGTVIGQAPGLHRAGGLLFEDPHTVSGLTEVTQVPVAPGKPSAALVSSVDLSAQMPPVGDQGQQGSCVAWSLGYYDKTHTEYVEHQWDLTQTAHQISPAFIYNQINGGSDQGAYFTDATKLICDQGACMLSDFPYNQSNCTAWPSESAFSHGILYRGQTAYYVSVDHRVGHQRGQAAPRQRPDLRAGDQCVRQLR